MDLMKALAVEYRKKLRDEEQRKAEEEKLRTLPIREWGEFRQLMRVKMVAFNRHMQEAILTWDTEVSNEILITRKNDGRMLKGKFDEVASSVQIKCAEAQVDFTCSIVVQAQAPVYLLPDGQLTQKSSLTRDGITNSLLRDFVIN